MAAYDDLDLEEGLDPEGPSAEDLSRFGDEFVTCPECGASVYDQAEMCHRCGHAMSREPGGVPRWALVVSVIVLIALVLVFVF
ncbi:MAG: hypothetical protein ACF8SC_08430 [Phycisphaerales bacterium JB037]